MPASLLFLFFLKKFAIFSHKLCGHAPLNRVTVARWNFLIFFINQMTTTCRLLCSVICLTFVIARYEDSEFFFKLKTKNLQKNGFSEYDRSKMPWDLRPIDRFIGLWSLTVTFLFFANFSIRKLPSLFLCVSLITISLFFSKRFFRRFTIKYYFSVICLLFVNHKKREKKSRLGSQHDRTMKSFIGVKWTATWSTATITNRLCNQSDSKVWSKSREYHVSRGMTGTLTSWEFWICFPEVF